MKSIKTRLQDWAARRIIGDGLTNLATGLGTSQSKTSHAFWDFEGLISNWQQYEAAYQSSWLARNIIDTIPADITREWREIKCNAADDIRIEEDRVGVVTAFRDALRWARLYGGAGIVMITDQPLDRPLNVERIRKGSLKRLVVLDRFYLAGNGVQIVDDVLNENFMLPSSYFLANAHDCTIDPSHVIRLSGEPLPPRMRFMNQGWGDSSLRIAMQPIKELLSAIGGVGESLQEFNVDVVTRDGLFTDLATDQNEAIRKRFEQFRLMKSIIHLAVLDGSEHLDRKSLTYAGIDTLLEKQMQMISGATHTPMTKLFGMSPGGLNATGDSDLRNYNDHLRSLQNESLNPALAKFDEVLVRSAIGSFPDDFNYEWKPLTTPDPARDAQVLQTKAQSYVTLIESGVITVSQAQRNLQAAEDFSFDDERIAELEEIEKKMPLDGMSETGDMDPGDAAAMNAAPASAANAPKNKEKDDGADESEAGERPAEEDENPDAEANNRRVSEKPDADSQEDDGGLRREAEADPPRKRDRTK